MTYEDLRTKLNTAATTAGISTYLFGWLWEINKVRNATYPCMSITPPNKPLSLYAKTESVITSLEFIILDEWKRSNEATTQEEDVFDDIDAVALSFLQALDGGSDFIVMGEDQSVPVELLPEGVTIENVVGVKYTVPIKIFC